MSLKYEPASELQALQMGVYDHIPGDGRELVVARKFFIDNLLVRYHRDD